VLRVGPYFQVLASRLQSLSFNIKTKLIRLNQDNPELSQTRVVKQVIIVKHNHDSLINNIPLMNYVLMATNK
jgi:hypothetical protein